MNTYLNREQHHVVSSTEQPPSATTTQPTKKCAENESHEIKQHKKTPMHPPSNKTMPSLHPPTRPPDMHIKQNWVVDYHLNSSFLSRVIHNETEQNQTNRNQNQTKPNHSNVTTRTDAIKQHPPLPSSGRQHETQCASCAGKETNKQKHGAEPLTQPAGPTRELKSEATNL